MDDVERIVATCVLLAPHRQRMVLQTAEVLLELQLQVDVSSDGHDDGEQ